MKSCPNNRNKNHKLDYGIYREAIYIRRVEEKLLQMFTLGKINGTIHTCVGQEFSALAFAGQLNEGDIVISNHRCHGHYLALTHDYKGLIAELMGKQTGVCGGIGSSQHLYRSNFLSNGIQGGMLPVAAGMALAAKYSYTGNIVEVFIGDGTLGEGIVYETLNFVSKLEIPLLIVCENNHYAQTTPIEINLAGDILKRADAFGIETKCAGTAFPEELFSEAKDAIKYVKEKGKPIFCLVDTYRLNSHSKSDDFRDNTEIDQKRTIDPLTCYQIEFPGEYASILESVDNEIEEIVAEVELHLEMNPNDYFDCPEKNYTVETKWKTLEYTDRKQAELINDFFLQVMQEDKQVIFIGEDVLSPYGGAFKVAKDLSFKFPGQVISTPISEAAITGIANGLALSGFRPFLEIMFGDFMTLCLDQIINHASKFYHMYNKKVHCPMVIRTPMGGGRGYGPTHSQTLDKFLVGIDNVSTVAINVLLDPRRIYKYIYEKEKDPVIVIENKIDYGRRLNMKLPDSYIGEESDHCYPLVRIRPEKSRPTATLVTYGGMVKTVIGSLERIFFDLDLKPELIVLSRICPIDIVPIIESVKITRKLYVIEGGSAFAGIGSEIISTVVENISDRIVARRIASQPVPVPACKTLEDEVLVNEKYIVSVIKDSITYG